MSSQQVPHPDQDGRTFIAGPGLNEAGRARLFGVFQAERPVEKVELYGDKESRKVQVLRDLKETLGLTDTAQIVYPGSSTDVSVARVFGQDNVTHVEPDEGRCKLLIGSGYRAIATRIEDYQPEQPADVIVAFNSYGELTPDILQGMLNPGGVVIANNYTGWAHDLARMPGMELIAAVWPDYDREDAAIYRGEDIPEDIAVGGTTEEEPRYPDALCVFRFAPI